mgnify:CR=1 FL=1
MAFPGGTRTGRDQLKEAGGQPMPLGSVVDQSIVFRDGINLIGLTVGSGLLVSGGALVASTAGVSVLSRALTNGEAVLVVDGEIAWSYA